MTTFYLMNCLMNGEEFIPYKWANKTMRFIWSQIEWDNLPIELQREAVNEYIVIDEMPRNMRFRCRKQPFPWNESPLVNAFDYDMFTGKIRRVDIPHVNYEQMYCGYKAVRWRGKEIYSHDLAWLLTHGEWRRVEHITNDKLDNRLCNLRRA